MFHRCVETTLEYGKYTIRGSYVMFISHNLGILVVQLVDCGCWKTKIWLTICNSNSLTHWGRILYFLRVQSSKIGLDSILTLLET